MLRVPIYTDSVAAISHDIFVSNKFDAVKRRSETIFSILRLRPSLPFFGAFLRVFFSRLGKPMAQGPGSNPTKFFAPRMAEAGKEAQ